MQRMLMNLDEVRHPQTVPMMSCSTPTIQHPLSRVLVTQFPKVTPGGCGIRIYVCGHYLLCDKVTVWETFKADRG